MGHVPAHGGRPLVFGEVLVDQLPGGRATLGGAPFNVAWHLQGFGLRPLLVTRVGEDAEGDAIREQMRRWDMDTVGVQLDPDHPTGRAQVRFRDGQPQFSLLADQAYDRIDAEAASLALHNGEWSVLYHGTLALRSALNVRTLQALRREVGTIFMDANLRAPWWEQEQVARLLTQVRWLKLSRAELRDLMGVVMDDEPTVYAVATELLRRYRLELLLVTDGENGAHYFSDGESGWQPVVPAAPLVDTVGAGDAFSAVCILGLIYRWPLKTILLRASEFAACICMRPGAAPSEPALYETLLERWAP